VRLPESPAIAQNINLINLLAALIYFLFIYLLFIFYFLFIYLFIFFFNSCDFGIY